MNEKSDIDNIDIFLEKLGRYWKCNSDLKFYEVVAILDSNAKLDRFSPKINTLDCVLDKLILESCYPKLCEEITQVYIDDLDGLEEVDKLDLINAILKCHIEKGSLIASTAMRLRVEGYLSVKVTNKSLDN